MGLDVVPETVRVEGPFGPGSAQRYVETDDRFDPLPLVRQGDPRLWPIAALDVIANNTDRKLGHILSTGDGLIAIDHGLTFHADPKLRTVLWCFAGHDWPPDLIDRAGRLRMSLASDPTPFRESLTTPEWEALLERIELLMTGPHPPPPGDRPPVPWPAY